MELDAIVNRLRISHVPNFDCTVYQQRVHLFAHYCYSRESV